MNAVKDIHHLSFVLVNSLNLNVVHSVDWDIEAGVVFDPLLEVNFIFSLDSNELFLEAWVSGVGIKLLEVVKSSNPLIDATKSITNKLRQLWIAAMNPSSRSDTIGLVLKFTWIEHIELLKDGIPEELRVKSGYTINGVRADDREESHSNLLWPSFFNQAHSLDFLVVSWVLLLQLLNVNVVDKIDKLEVSWEESADELNGPFFEGFWENSMIGVGKGVINNVPSLFEREGFFIDEDSEELDGGNSWMSIIQLDFVELGKSGESIIMFAFISTDDIIDRG